MMKKTVCLLMVLLMLAVAVSCETEPVENVRFTAISINGVTVTLDAKAEPILSSFGNALNYSESPSCAFEGMDKIYAYNGFRVETYTLKGVDYIRKVELIDDTYATPEGSRIGDSAESVIEKHGDATLQNDTQIVYEAQNGKLQFLIRDGKVTNIQYLKAE